MMFVKKIALVAALSALTSSALAIDGTIQFKGAFTASPCEFNVNGSAGNGNTITVPLGTWATANFINNVGATTDLKPITFNLSNCPDMKQANIRFNGQADSLNPGLFAIQSGTDMASNVGIGMYKTNNTADLITPNSQSLTVPLTAKAGEVTVYANYMTTSNDVKEGNANADVTIDISYE